MNFKEITVVHHRANEVFHVVGAHGIVRHDGIQYRIHTARIITRGGNGRIFHVVVGEEAQELFDLIDGVRIAFAGKVRHAALGVVGHGAAQLLLGHHLTQNRLDHIGSGDEHVAGLLHHENEIGHGRGIHRSTGARSHDGGNLRDHAGSDGIAVENLAVAGERIDTFLDAGAAGIVEADEGLAGLERQIHDLADLLGMHLAQSPGTGGEILGKGKHLPAIHRSVAGDDAVGGNIHLVETEQGPSVLDEHIQFAKAARIKKVV